jgi:hypothetical protein
VTHDRYFTKGFERQIYRKGRYIGMARERYIGMVRDRYIEKPEIDT